MRLGAISNRNSRGAFLVGRYRRPGGLGLHSSANTGRRRDPARRGVGVSENGRVITVAARRQHRRRRARARRSAARERATQRAAGPPALLVSDQRWTAPLPLAQSASSVATSGSSVSSSKNVSEGRAPGRDDRASRPYSARSARGRDVAERQRTRGDAARGRRARARASVAAMVGMRCGRSVAHDARAPGQPARAKARPRPAPSSRTLRPRTASGRDRPARARRPRRAGAPCTTFSCRWRRPGAEPELRHGGGYRDGLHDRIQ